MKQVGERHKTATKKGECNMSEDAQVFNVRSILESLKIGKPIGGEAGSQILSSSYKRAIAPVIKSILQAQGNGLIGGRDVFWVYGKPGNGKTQTLKQLVYVIPSRSAVAKFAYVVIDLDKKPEAQQSESLIPVIVRATLSSKAINDVEKIQTKITEVTPTEENLSFAIDIISELAQVSALKLFLGFGIHRIFQFFRSREGYIKSVLKKQWGNSPELLRLLTAWLQYTLKPSLENSEKLDTLLKDLASHGVLFSTFKFALEKAGYSTLVIILDEVKNVTIHSLKTLWDPEDDDENSTGLNLIFVLSAQEEVIKEIRANEALERRFFRTPNGIIQLSGPEIKEHGEDDIEHAVFTIDKFLSDYPEYRSAETNLENTINELRNEFLDQDKTWQDLWQAVMRKLTTL